MKIVIAGRPNTGKSTLFNALTGTRDALVHDRPGVTRDVVQGELKPPATSHQPPVTICDTAGLENSKSGIAADSTKLALSAIENSDAVLFVVDARAGILPQDLEWAKIIKKARAGARGDAPKSNNILLLANKSESNKKAADLSEFYKLGFGAPIPISAEHKQGLDAIYDWIEKPENKNAPASHQPPATSHEESRLKIAILGQPNVGKSTLMNKILGENRVLVRDEPGITRDTIKISAGFLGRDIMLMDTAGLRRKSGVTDDVETLSALKSLDAIAKTDVVLLIADATKNIENQTLGIAARVYEAGKILCVALNKWDLVPADDRGAKLLKLKHQFGNSFSQIIRPLILPISAESGTGVRNMMKRIYELWDISNTRAPTSVLNRATEKLVAAHQPPMSRLKRPMKIKFVHQTKTHPITVAINVGGASDIPESYTRYLRRGIAQALNWEQLPVVIEYSKSENPYDSDKVTK
ncbi:MAG: ribosome biogenesis GTPase Der [Proteobacteria bacterium]|nr:ribosome biogenesis GTPase Der [Pseudomonadota bacterium]